MLNDTLMRAIELQMEQQDRLKTILERKGTQTTEEVIRRFYHNKFEWSILASISGNLAFGFEQVAEGE